MSNQNFAGNDGNEKERESTNPVSYLGRIINPPEIPTIPTVISALQSRSIPFPSGNPNSDEGLNVNPPFPPNIEPRVLANGLFNRQKKSKKMLNEFFIYRGEYVRELKRLNIRPKQTKVSALASTSWHNQPPNVKDEYRRLARETEKLFIAEKQREASESPRLVFNKPLPKDSTSTSTPVPVNVQLPLPSLSEQPMSGLQTNNAYLDNYCARNLYQMHSNYLFPYLRSTPTTPYIVDPTFYHNAETIVPSQSVQETDFFTNYRQTR